MAVWSSRRLKTRYAIVAFDHLPIRIREGAGVRESVLLYCLGIASNGEKDILGLWQSTGPQSWAPPLLELRRRGLAHWHLALADFGAEVNSHLGADVMQTLPRLVRRSLILVPPRRRKAIAAGLSDIVRAEKESDARNALARFASSRGGADYPHIVEAWTRAWPRLEPLYALPMGVRRFLEAFDALDTLKAKLARRAARLTLCFASEEEALRQTEAALLPVATGWKVGPGAWEAPRRYFDGLDHAAWEGRKRLGAGGWRARVA